MQQVIITLQQSLQPVSIRAETVRVCCLSRNSIFCNADALFFSVNTFIMLEIFQLLTVLMV